MDNTIRDLAELRGTYRLIDKTDTAIALIGESLQSMEVSGVVFYLDAPVSNAGRLKTRIIDILSRYNFTVTVEIVENPDTVLKTKAYVVTSDAVILDNCISWVNLGSKIISWLETTPTNFVNFDKPFSCMAGDVRSSWPIGRKM